ncbi:unnamed protein product [Ixodes persulcatus]
MICTFCIFLVVGAVACVVTAAPLTRHESPRGALLAMEGVLELLPENSGYCARGRLQAVAAFRAEVFNAVEDRMNAIFGNVSTACSYSTREPRGEHRVFGASWRSSRSNLLPAALEEPSEPLWHPV